MDVFCCCGFTAVHQLVSVTLCQNHQTSGVQELFRVYFPFVMGENAQTGKQRGCHILHFISRLLNKYTYNKAKIIMDLHLTDSLCLVNSEETCSLGHSVFKCHQLWQHSADLHYTKKYRNSKEKYCFFKKMESHSFKRNTKTQSNEYCRKQLNSCQIRQKMMNLVFKEKYIQVSLNSCVHRH